MNKELLKTEIQKLLNNVPDETLEEVYNMLKGFADKNPEAVKLSHNLNRILTEDKGLLERLAK